MVLEERTTYRRSGGWVGRVVPLASIALALGGCFLVSWLPGRRDSAEPVPGPAVYVEGCRSCHPALVDAQYGQSLHATKGIRCGQCHTAAGHPNYAQPVRDTTCGGCHQPQYQQTLGTRHFATRDQRALDGDRAARVALRREGFTAAGAGARRFVGDSSSGELGGRLCAACHYDEHRLGLRPVQRADFCLGCHPGREANLSSPTLGLTNPCLQCHVRIGATESGQVLNTHLVTSSGVGHR